MRTLKIVAIGVALALGLLMANPSAQGRFWVLLNGAMQYNGPVTAATYTGTAGTVTTSTPIVNLTQTWNAGGVTFTGIKELITDTASAAGSLLIDLQTGAGTKFNVDKSGNVTAGNSVIGGAGGNIQAATGRYFVWASRNAIGATADKLVQVLDAGAATGMELNGGTPTLGTCTGGSLTSGSHNFAGEYTGNTSSSCIINFGTPNFTNTPFCFAESEASLTHPRISARSTSSITVTGGVSGEAIQYWCVGRIGT